MYAISSIAQILAMRSTITTLLIQRLARIITYMIEYSSVVPHEISDTMLMKDIWLSKTLSQPDDFNKNSNKKADIKFSVHDVFLE